jgi:hypothetical protein
VIGVTFTKSEIKSVPLRKFPRKFPRLFSPYSRDIGFLRADWQTRQHDTPLGDIYRDEQTNRVRSPARLANTISAASASIASSSETGFGVR